MKAFIYLPPSSLLSNKMYCYFLQHYTNLDLNPSSTCDTHCASLLNYLVLLKPVVSSFIKQA